MHPSLSPCVPPGITVKQRVNASGRLKEKVESVTDSTTAAGAGEIVTRQTSTKRHFAKRGRREMVVNEG